MLARYPIIASCDLTCANQEHLLGTDWENTGGGSISSYVYVRQLVTCEEAPVAQRHIQGIHSPLIT